MTDAPHDATAAHPFVRLEVADGIARITLTAADRLNATDAPMLEAIIAAVRRVSADDAVRVVAITGEGRGFCSGAHLGDGDGDPREGDSLDSTLFAFGELSAAIMASPKPTVALVSGVAAGAGVSIALACDYQLVSDAAFFTLAFTRIGLMPDGGATSLVAANIGRTRAMRLAMTGERVTAATAGDWGMVSEVVPAESFGERAEQLLALFAELAPRAVAATKGAVNDATLDLAATLAIEEPGQQALLRSDDFAEGVFAFREKRAARFTGA